MAKLNPAIINKIVAEAIENQRRLDLTDVAAVSKAIRTVYGDEGAPR